MLVWVVHHKVPAVVLSDSNEHDARRSPLREAIKRCIIRCFASALVGGRSNAAYLELLGMPMDRIFLGYDIVDNAHFARGAILARTNEIQERIRLGLTTKPFFLASARFVRLKNLVGLVDAYARYISTTADPWDLVLLGDGVQRAEIERRIAFHNIAARVTMPGFKQYDDLPIYYGLASAFVHFSNIEPWGLVVNEAMASGLPIIVSSKCGCTKDLVVEGKNGFVVDPGDLGTLAERLGDLTNMDRSERDQMGAQSQTIIAQWSPSRFAEGARAAAETAIKTGSGPVSLISRAVLNVYSRVA
jgi:glycosyltransferase involved in cell wall biosynthesis